MAIATLAAYKAALAAGRELMPIQYPQFTLIAGRSYNGFLLKAPTAGAVAPTAAVAPTNATAGSLGQLNPSSGQLSAIGGNFASQSTGAAIFCDILSHQGGLSGTVTSAQVTNLPTAALTRYTNGIGVFIALTIYTQIGATATTVSASYTNQSDVSGRITPLVVFGGTGFRENQRMILLPLESGDTGVKAVASVTVTATTGTAGTFGVTLFKPLFAVSIRDAGLTLSAAGLIDGNFGPGLPTILDGACLVPMFFSTTITVSGLGKIHLAEN